MDRSRKQISWFGVALIIFGTVILLHRLHVIRVGFDQILWAMLMLVGIMGVVKGFSRDRRGKIFWGTVWFLLGLFFLLHSIDRIEFRAHMFPPAMFLIVGLAFLMTYLNDLHDWYILIPAFILTAIGGAFILADFGYLTQWEVWEAVRMYWPVALIILGAGLIMRRKMRLPSNPPTA